MIALVATPQSLGAPTPIPPLHPLVEEAMPPHPLCLWTLQWEPLGPPGSGESVWSDLAYTQGGDARHTPQRAAIVAYAKSQATEPGRYSLLAHCTDAAGRMTSTVPMTTDAWTVDAGAQPGTPPPGPEQLGLPAYVGAAISDRGTPYYKVLDEYATAVAGALNNFNTTGAQGITEQVLWQTLQRVAPGMGDAARAVGDAHQNAAQATGRGPGIVLRGDVFQDAELGVSVTYVLPKDPTAYVLVEPDAGWEESSDSGWLGPELEKQLKRAAVGWRWGALIGGGVAITLIGLHVMRRRRR